MKSSKIVSLIVVLCLVMTCVAVVGVPVVSAIGPAASTSSLYRDGFEYYSGNQGYQATLQGLKNYGWYAADYDTLYTNVDTVAPYSTMSYTLAEIATVDTTHCLHIVSAGNSNSTANQTVPTYGYGKQFPGVAANGAATGSWEITFDFKPVLADNNQTQFAFTLNTADSSATGETAQHNIIAGYGTNFYLGYRDYATIKNSSISQGTLPAGKIGGVRWYRVKTYLNCDARYYSVELYDKSTGKLIARRSPISFAADETIGFLKFSALGYTKNYEVYVDNVSIEKKATADTTVYNETFDSFTNASYRASVAMSGETNGSSYFEGYTPWRELSGVGNAYDLVANDDTLNSQVVKLGNGAASGLVYVQANEELLTASTQPLRGLLKTSFKFKPLTAGTEDVMLITPSELSKINNSSYAAFKFTNDGGKIMLRNNRLNPSRWYKAEIYFDVVDRVVTTVLTDMVGNQSILYTSSGANATPSAVKGMMFKVPSDWTVLMDDFKIEYCSAAPTEAPTPVPTAVPTAEPTAVPTEEPTEAPLTAPTVSMTAKSAANSENAFYYMITVTLNDGTADAFVVKHFPDDRDEAIAKIQNFNVSNISGVTANLISVLKDIPPEQADREIKTKVTLNYTLGGASGSANAENITSLNAMKE